MADVTITTAEIDKTFGEVYQALSLKDQRKALKSAMRKEGNRVRKAAMENVKTSGLKDSHGNIEKELYTRVFPDRYGTGFIVTAKPHGNKGIHTNSRGKKKPILLWADAGTDSRNVGPRKLGKIVKAKSGNSYYRKYKRSGHSTGRMKALNFIEKTERQEEGNVEDSLFKTFSDNLEKAARKKGLL